MIAVVEYESTGVEDVKDEQIELRRRGFKGIYFYSLNLAYLANAVLVTFMS